VGAFTGLIISPVNAPIGVHDRGRDIASRCVLIPEDLVQWNQGGRHVRVTVSLSTSQVACQLCHVDREPEQPVDSEDLKSKLFKSYLQAVTSYCLKDEVTGRTGTEEALATLSSASVRSFPHLSREDIELLMVRARLTPYRQYCPAQLRDMQQIKWDALRALSHYRGFHDLVMSVPRSSGRCPPSLPRPLLGCCLVLVHIVRRNVGRRGRSVEYTKPSTDSELPSNLAGHFNGASEADETATLDRTYAGHLATL
jgi:hypothetical protein